MVMRDDERDEQHPTMKRRGILAAAGAAVALIATKQEAEPVAAATFLTLGNNDTVTNATTAPTIVDAAFAYGPVSSTLFTVDASTASSATTQVTGLVAKGSPGGGGVAATGGARGPGILNAGIGVIGTGGGVSGFSGIDGAAADGVVGYGGNAGRAGDREGFGGNGLAGFGGFGATQSGAGVYGQSEGGIGVSALSNGSYGIVGVTTAGSPYSGITGRADTNGAAAFAGGTSNPNSYAAYFSGRTVVEGDFTVVGGAKNAAVKHADGSYRLLHCVESPEPWFEDFGTGQLVNGRAQVRLDPDFAAVVSTDEYRVFPVPEGECRGLYVAGKTAAGFEVRELGGGTSNVAFAWRVVAKRKDLAKAQRLAKFELPKIKIPTADDLPKPPEPPKMPNPPPAPAPAPPPRATGQPSATTAPPAPAAATQPAAAPAVAPTTQPLPPSR